MPFSAVIWKGWTLNQHDDDEAVLHVIDGNFWHAGDTRGGFSGQRRTYVSMGKLGPSGSINALG